MMGNLEAHGRLDTWRSNCRMFMNCGVYFAKL
jgi:hypothetical protein